MKLDEVEEIGRNRQEGLVSIPPKTTDICCVMYTSVSSLSFLFTSYSSDPDSLDFSVQGSTGDPKGVTLTHANMVAAVGAVHHLLYEIFEETDRYLAYLPLAHILELAVELSWMFVGMPIGYGRVKTLTDASVRGCKGDIAECRPTIMCGVPAVVRPLSHIPSLPQKGTLSESCALFLCVHLVGSHPKRSYRQDRLVFRHRSDALQHRLLGQALCHQNGHSLRPADLRRYRL
jgi:acyl-CoA synthetase (AMP-forming)/AMP-acid ligase II